MTITPAFSDVTLDPTASRRVQNFSADAPVVSTSKPDSQESAETIYIDKSIDARQRILIVAISMFSSNGYDGVSTTQIAKASGVTQPLIHYHFKSKFSLWKACVSQAFSWLDKEFTQPVKSSLGEDKKQNVNMMIDRFVSFASARPEFSRFLLSEGSQESERLSWMVAEFVKPLAQQLETLYTAGVESGLLKKMPVAQLVSMVLGAATQFYAWKPMLVSAWSVDPEEEAQAKLQRDTVIEFIKNAVLV